MLVDVWGVMKWVLEKYGMKVRCGHNGGFSEHGAAVHHLP